jgi:COMPASS component SWD3
MVIAILVYMNKMNNPNQPRKHDAVLGGQAPPPIHGVILGGIEGVEKRLATGLPEYQTAALNDALNYGDAGLNVILKSLQNTTGKVKLLAYSHLRTRSETWVQEALKAYNQYEFLQCVQTFREQKSELGKVNAVALSLDNQLVYANLKTLKSWDLQANKQASFFKCSKNSEINCVVINPDGKRMISACSDGCITVWDFSTGRLLNQFKAHSRSVNALVINPSENNFISAGAEGSIKTWDLYSCKELGTLFSKGYSQQLTYAMNIIPTGKILISGSNETIRVWDLRAKREVWKLEGHSHVIKSLAISPDGKTLVSGSDQRIKVWDIQLGQEIFSFYGHADWVRCIVFSPDGQSFITAGDTKIKVWDVSTGKKLHSFQAHDDVVSSLALSYDGATLVSGSYDGTVKIWRS